MHLNKSKTLFLLFLVIFIPFTVLKSQENEKDNIKNVIHEFFQGLQNGDTLQIAKVVGNELLLQTIYKNKEDINIQKTETKEQFLKAVSSKKPDDVWEEKLLSISIENTSDLAHVWTPYEFYFNHSFSHYGVNSFQLYKSPTGWKIISITDTRKRRN